MEAIPCLTRTCWESSSGLGIVAQKNAVDLSRDLLNAFGTLENLDQATVTEMCQVKGIGPAKAAQIKAALEVGKHMASKPASIKTKLKSSQAFVDHFSPFLKNLKKNYKNSALGSQTSIYQGPDYFGRKFKCQYCSPKGGHDSCNPGIRGILCLNP